MNKILAEGSSQNITVVNGKVIDNNNSSFKVKSNDNKKFDIDIMNNNDGLLIRELNKREIVKLLKNNNNKSLSLLDKLKKFSVQEHKVKNRRRTRKRSNKKKSKRGKRESRKRGKSRKNSN
jgi:hypothetical protein